MNTVNPQMIILAREARGWTQKDLATLLQVRQSTVSRYEIGIIPVPPNHLAAIASALNFEPDFFCEMQPRLVLAGDFLYRKRSRVSAKVQRQVEAEANVRKMQVIRLLRSGQIAERFAFPAIAPEEMEGRIDRIAQEVRRAFRLPSGPIANLTRVLENAGAIIFPVDFGTELVDGTNLRLPGVPPLFFMNKNVPGERHRYNLAHELGHSVMHFSTAVGDPEEEAHAFANEFLMPKAEIRSDLRNLDLAAALRLKQFWGVSMQAIIRRAHQLKLISNGKYRNLFQRLSMDGLRLAEPVPLKFERPELFDRLIQLHREELGFGDDEMRRLLFTDQLGTMDVPASPRLRLTGGLFDQSEVS